jgi:hypothetical protein
VPPQTDFVVDGSKKSNAEDHRMDRAASARWLVGWFLGITLLWRTGPARAQSPQSDRNQKVGQAAAGQAQAQANRRGASATTAEVPGPPKAQAGDAALAPARREFSEAYRESLRRTVEKNRQLRARRRSGSEATGLPGAIVPWPMPPALIIRQTREVHGEISSFLDVIKR